MVVLNKTYIGCECCVEIAAGWPPLFCQPYKYSLRAATGTGSRLKSICIKLLYKSLYLIEIKKSIKS